MLLSQSRVFRPQHLMRHWGQWHQRVWLWQNTTKDQGFLTYSEADLRGFFNSFRFATGRYTGKNFNEMFAQLGFTHLIFNIDVSDNFVHRVSLYDTAQCPENLLAQFVKTSNTPFFDDRTVSHECCAMETDSLSEGKQRSVFSTPKALTRKLQGSQSIMRMALRKGCRICVAISMGAT